jgi:hypothetical protein
VQLFQSSALLIQIYTRQADTNLDTTTQSGSIYGSRVVENEKMIAWSLFLLLHDDVMGGGGGGGWRNDGGAGLSAMSIADSVTTQQRRLPTRSIYIYTKINV